MTTELDPPIPSEPSAPVPEAPVELAPPPPPPPPPVPLLQRLEGLVTALAALPLGAPILAGVLALCPGLLLGTLLHGPLSWLLDNRLGISGRRTILAIQLCAALVVGIAHAVRARRAFVAAAGAALADRLAAAHATIAPLNRWLLPLLALPLAPLLLQRGAETRAAGEVLTASFVAGVAIAAAVYFRVGDRVAPAAPPSRLFWLPVVGLVLAYGLGFSWLSIVRHQALLSKIFDLGIYDSIFWHSSHGRALGANFVKGGSHVAAHFDPVLVLLSPIYRLWPRAETILALQAFWLGSTVVPLFLLGRDRAGSPWIGLALGLVWALHPAVHGANLYDFHSLSLVAPIVPWLVWLLETRRWIAYGAVIALGLLIREDVSLSLSFVGLYALLTGHRPRVAVVTIGAALLYLVAVKGFVMPDAALIMEDSGESYSFGYYYKDLIPNGAEGARGLVVSLLTNPSFVLTHVTTEEKLLFLAKLFVPMLFVPLLLGARARLLLIYGFAFLFLATRTAVYSLHFQYTMVLVPAALAVTAVALGRLQRGEVALPSWLDGRRLALGLAAGMVVAAAGVGARFGAITPNDAFRPGGQAHIFSMTEAQHVRHAFVERVRELVPATASVAVTDYLGPQLSGRKTIHLFPWGRGAEWLALDSANLEAKSRRYWEKLERGGAYTIVEREGTLLLAQRNPAIPLPERDP